MVLEEEFLERIVSSLDLLINAISDNKIELGTVDRDIVRKLEDAKRKLLLLKKLDFNTLAEVKEILKFKRFYPILEIGDKDKDIEDFWTIPLREIGKLFFQKWNLKESEVMRIVENYEVVLKLGFLEAIMRKGLENSESDVIRGIRFNLGRGRLLEEYMLNLVVGWLVEDLVKNWFETKVLLPLKEAGKIKDFKIEYGAHDQERVIKFSGGEITGEPDFRLVLELPSGERKIISLEVQRIKKSYTGERNIFGEVKMQVPGHRKSVEEKVLASGEIFLMILVEVEKGLVGLALNPNERGKIEERKQYSYVWGQVFESSDEGVKKVIEFFEKEVIS